MAVAEAPEAEPLALRLASGEAVSDIAGRGTGVAPVRQGLPGNIPRSMLVEHR